MQSCTIKSITYLILCTVLNIVYLGSNWTMCSNCEIQILIFIVQWTPDVSFTRLFIVFLCHIWMTNFTTVGGMPVAGVLHVVLCSIDSKDWQTADPGMAKLWVYTNISPVLHLLQSCKCVLLSSLYPGYILRKKLYWWALCEHVRNYPLYCPVLDPISLFRCSFPN